MITVQAFNTMLKKFLEDLAEVFPEKAEIQVFLDGFDAMVAISPKAPLTMFMEALAPHSALAMAKDPALFDKLRFPGGIDFADMWGCPDLSDNTREAIWQYINTLFMLGMTVQSVPPDMLENIETIAQNCADKVQSGQLDFSAIGSMLMNGGLGDLAGLAGLDDHPPGAGSEDTDDEPRGRRLARGPHVGGRRPRLGNKNLA